MNRSKDENSLKEQIYKQVYDLIYHQFDNNDFSVIDVKVYNRLMVGIYNQVRNAVEFDIKLEITNRIKI